MSHEEIIIGLPLPPTLNSTYRASYSRKLGRGIFYKTSAAKKWVKLVDPLVKKRSNLFLGACEVHLVVRTKVAADIDGRIKPVLDVLQGKVYKNDKQVKRLEVYTIIDRAHPEIDIVVREIKK